MNEYPDDEDGDVLRALESNGLDMTAAVEIEFYCYAENSKNANAVCESDDFEEFITDIFIDEKSIDLDKKYSVYFSQVMVPTYENVIQTQEKLNMSLKTFRTRCDGWGVLIPQ